MTLRVHHIALTAVDLPATGAAYDAVLGVLGYRRHHDSDGLITWTGTDAEPEFLLWAVEGDDTTPHRHGQPGLQHICLQVDDPATVDAAHTAAQSTGWTIVHPPRAYPEYQDGYYATFIADEAGNRIELAHIPNPTH